MTMRDATKQLKEIIGLTVLAPGRPISISNKTIADLAASVELINAPERKPLAGLWDMPRLGLHFAEFWEECAQIEFAGHTGEVFGLGRTECFLRSPNEILHLAFDMETRRIDEITYAAPEMMQFVKVYRRFLALILSQDLDAASSAQIAACLCSDFPDLTERDGPNGMVNYWWGIADALTHEELNLGPDFLYFRDRAASQQRT